MQLKALAEFRYADRMLSIGDLFTPSDIHARLLVALKRAAYINEQIETPKPKRRSKTTKEKNE